MAGSKGIKGEIVLEYLKKYPKSSKKSLGKLIAKDYPLLFSAESARCSIRLYTNAHGDKNRNTMKSAFDKTSPYTRDNPYGLPETLYEEYPPFIIPPSVKSLLIGSDFHFSFQDNLAIKKWLDYGIGENVDGILLNGDIMDMYSVSRFLKIPKVDNIKKEFEDVRNFLKMLRDKFPNVPIYFKEGNHEERWELNLRTNAKALFGMEEFELPTLLRMGELNIDYIRDKRIVKYAGLNIIHGHEVPFASTANGARSLFLKTGVSTLASHVHRTSEHIEKNLDGKVTGSWTIGCLSGLNPEYAIRSNKYNHGWAHVVRDADYFSVKNIKLIDYKIL